MPAPHRSRLVNPQLGTYFGIFTSLLVASVLLLLILEQLGVDDRLLRTWIAVAFIGLFCSIGVAAFTQLPAEFFASGRRVPAFFNGLVIACATLGGAGLAAIGGSLFFAGFDALCFGIGMIGGLVCMVVLIMPFLRKVGAYTIPGYLGRRFDSSSVRLAATAILAVPMLLLLMAELKVAGLTLSWLTNIAEGEAIWIMIAACLLIVLPGGMRSLTWSSAAAAIASIGALVLPAVIVAVMTTYLPLPQMTHGPVLRALMRLEVTQGVPAPVVAPLSISLPGMDLQPILHRFATPFSSLGPAAFVLAALAVMVGIAGSPALLSRAGTTPAVYETRKSLGWAAVVLGIVLMTLSAVAVFMRDVVMNQLVTAAQEPEWFHRLASLGLAGRDASATAGSLASFFFRRDWTLVALPVTLGCPAVLVYLSAIGIVAAALAGASAAIATLGAMLAEDVVAPGNDLTSDAARVMSARIAVMVTAVGGGWLAAMTPGDPFELFLWSLALSGSTAFPALLLSIWWKRANAWGTLAGLACGFVVAAIAIMAGEIASIGLPGALAAVAGAPVAFAATLIVSVLTPAPNRHVLDMVRELRVPGGETVYDREARLALLQQQRA